MISKIKYSFSGKIWQHSGPGGWFFISIPEELSMEIRNAFRQQEEGWGRLQVLARLKQLEWKTAIWFDSKKQTYLLPLKAEIRKKEGIGLEEFVEIVLEL